MKITLINSAMNLNNIPVNQTIIQMEKKYLCKNHFFRFTLSLEVFLHSKFDPVSPKTYMHVILRSIISK
jgi:hypothetical protein